MKMTKYDTQLISNKFSKNIVLDEQATKKNSNSLVIIYKNLISDMRIYYNQEYNNFLESHHLDVKSNLVLLPLYPVLIQEFLKQRFDQELINKFYDGDSMKFYFYIASFLQPKIMMNLFEINRNVVINQIYH